ncbi:MAG: tripartite tricarboxylate transporter substrate-binding protein [Sphaerochaeta sp.]|jgi:putative tricarboxylic transport membrane protein
MKKNVLLAIVLLVALVMPVMAQGSSESSGAFAPSKDIEWFVTSSPGGGSDIYTRSIEKIMTQYNLVNGKTFLVMNKTDGGGEVGRLQVSRVGAGNNANHTLLTFNSGDHDPMLRNTANRIANFTPIAVMAVDKQLLFIGEHSKYKDWAEILTAINAGKNIVIAGSKGDDILTYGLLIEELGVSENQVSFITNDATSDAITSVLGGHVDLVLGKPAAADQYVEAGKLIPVLALSTSRFTGNLAGAPTLSETGPYKDVENAIWRGVVAPGAMSDAAAEFWSNAFKAVAESPEWKRDYIDKYKLVPEFKDWKEAKAYMEEFERTTLQAIGK